MKLWDYLKVRMRKYMDTVAFFNSKLTYADLLAFEEGNSAENTLVLCEGETREDLALSILKCIATGKVAVPVTREYGKKNCGNIRSLVADSNNEDLEDLAFIMFTSGTTGIPKGIMLTHENIITNLEYIRSYFRIEKMKNICIGRPLVHIAVLTGELLYALCNGLTIYFYEETFMPHRLLSYFVCNKIDIFCATPTLYQLLATVDKNKKCPLKIGVISGEVLTDKVGKQIALAFPQTEFYNVYGLTEHSPRVSALLPSEFKEKPNSVGKAIGEVCVKIVDSELLVKSRCVMKGYYKDEMKTKEKIKDGWLYTGDKAHMDPDGYLYIDGRKDTMLIVSGINIYPEEIENVIKNFEGIDDCLVYGEDTEKGVKLCIK